MMKKSFITKKLISILFISLLVFNFFGQTEDLKDDTASESKTNTEEVKEKSSESKKGSFKEFMSKVDFVLQFDPSMYLSPESSKNKSNVINMVYPITFGALWPNDYFIAVQPTLTFFMMEHLWYDQYALPAEIENRTTTTLSFMLNIPAVYSFYFKNKSKLQLAAGVGMLMRFGILANGVDGDDSGYSGSAEKDVENINKWFWEKAHWLYFTTGASWLYPITSKIQVGPTINAYIPMGTLFDQQSVQGLMISIGVKLAI